MLLVLSGYYWQAGAFRLLVSARPYFTVHNLRHRYDEWVHIDCDLPSGERRAASGIIAAVTTYLSDNGCYLSELHQFDDEETGRFFLRTVGRITQDKKTIDDLEQGFSAIADPLTMDWEFHGNDEPMRTLILVSKMDHCLEDLLYRQRKGELHIDITAVVSNHLDCRSSVERAGLRFVHLPVTPDNKLQQEQALRAIIEETQTSLVVLARYMQILSDQLCQELYGCAINIHHSFLPGFKGAKPYHQAYERGVKLIGATAHYVTTDLDEGPIIEQAVQLPYGTCSLLTRRQWVKC
jgi:formyltetrahydrofolate deformylase